MQQPSSYLHFLIAAEHLHCLYCGLSSPLPSSTCTLPSVSIASVPSCSGVKQRPEEAAQVLASLPRVPPAATGAAAAGAPAGGAAAAPAAVAGAAAAAGGDLSSRMERMEHQAEHLLVRGLGH